MKNHNRAIMTKDAQELDVLDFLRNPTKYAECSFHSYGYYDDDSADFVGFNKEAGSPNLGAALGVAAEFVADVYSVDVSRVYFTNSDGFDCGLAYEVEVEDEWDEEKGDYVPFKMTHKHTWVCFGHPSAEETGNWALFSLKATNK